VQGENIYIHPPEISQDSRGIAKGEKGKKKKTSRRRESQFPEFATNPNHGNQEKKDRRGGGKGGPILNRPALIRANRKHTKRKKKRGEKEKQEPKSFSGKKEKKRKKWGEGSASAGCGCNEIMPPGWKEERKGGKGGKKGRILKLLFPPKGPSEEKGRGGKRG